MLFYCRWDIPMVEGVSKYIDICIGNQGPFQYKDCLSGYGEPILEIRHSWDRDHLIFIMRIPILVIQHLYIRMTPWCALGIWPSLLQMMVYTYVQSSAVITWSNLPRYYIGHFDNSGRKWMRYENHNTDNRCPWGQDMGCLWSGFCLLWGFWRKLTAL